MWVLLRASEEAGMTANQMQDRQCWECHSPKFIFKTAVLGSPVARKSMGELCITS